MVKQVELNIYVKWKNLSYDYISEKNYGLPENTNVLNFLGINDLFLLSYRSSKMLL